MNSCRRCIVSGRVQGVFYRASTQQQAQRLGLSGWARNLPDGTVEVVVCGETDKVEQLCTWLRQGPAHASVTDVHCQQWQGEVPLGFSMA